jgi:hypothetical protein
MAAHLKLPTWCWALGAAGLVLAARLHEIHLHTGDVAINDQWKIEAADIIAPWLDGTLRPQAFFAPHFEHVPAWTRLIAWLEVALTGRWDPFVQTTVNALIFSGFVALTVHWIATNLRLLAACTLTALLVFNASLTHDWENITWGFQSQFPLALLCLFLHVHGSFACPPGSRGWWWAQGAALAGLFTLASMWIAPLAVVLASLWTARRDSRWRLAPLVPAALGLAIIALIHNQAPPGYAFAQTAGSPLRFLYALLDQLGWPASWPGAVAVLNLPFLLFALQLRGRKHATAFDCTALALGLWAAGQAFALAYARNAEYGGYVSRYGELLGILMLVNAAALVRLLPTMLRWRPAGVLFAVIWTGIVVSGGWKLSIGGHAQYFHERSATNARIRLEAVQAYLLRGDRSQLERPGTRWVLYQVVDQVTSLLDQPRFRAVLPAAVNPANPPDPTGTTVRQLQALAPICAGAAGLLLLAGVGLHARNAPPSPLLPAFTLQPEPLLPWLAAPTAIVAGALIFCWPDPLTFDLGERWRFFFNPPGSLGPLGLHIVTGSQQFPDEQLVGAAPLSPLEVRFQFSGTNPAGPGLTCTAWSRPFTVQSPWFVVPHAGWPVAHGNGLRFRIEEPDGRFITEVACEGPNPVDIGFWSADLRPYQGKQARLVLYDGRTDTEAWVAAAPPIATLDPSLALKLPLALARERIAPAHSAFGVLAIVSIALFSGWNFTRCPLLGRRGPRSETP